MPGRTISTFTGLAPKSGRLTKRPRYSQKPKGSGFGRKRTRPHPGSGVKTTARSLPALCTGCGGLCGGFCGGKSGAVLFGPHGRDLGINISLRDAGLGRLLLKLLKCEHCFCRTNAAKRELEITVMSGSIRAAGRCGQ